MKEKNEQITLFDVTNPRWYMLWVGAITLAGGVSVLARWWFLFRVDFNPRGMGLNALSLVLVLLSMGAQAVALPNPIRQDWRHWLLFGTIGMVFGTATGNLFFMQMMSSPMRSVGVALYYGVISQVWSLFVVGMALWIVMRRYVVDPQIWVIGLVFASLVAFGAESGVRTSGVLLMLFNAPPAISFLYGTVSPLVFALISGYILRWLLLNRRQG